MDQSPTAIRSGRIFDGSGAPARAGMVLVEGGRVREILPADSPPPPGAEVFDAGGLCVAPGFIDIHAHGDIEPLAAPGAESKLLCGVTTELCGNCGSTPFPLNGTTPGYLREKARRLGVEIDWHSADEYFARQEACRPAINRLFLVGHGRLRGNEFGMAARTADRTKIERMAAALDQALREGAWGLSAGLAYAPGCHAGTEELVELCRVVASHGGLYAAHLRSEADGIFEALDETLHLARASGVRVQISHLKLSGKPNWPNLGRLRGFLEHAREEGIDLGADWYPYEASNANLDSLLPNWVYEGGTHRLLSRLRDPKMRFRLADHILELSRSEMTWDRIRVARVLLEENLRFRGRSILEIAEELGMPPEDAFFNLVIAEGGRAEGFMFSMSRAVQAEIFSWPWVCVGSDATARPLASRTETDFPHPRTYGCHPRVLRRAREEGLLPLAEAVRRMTSLPAERIGLSGRGRLNPGAAADLTLFDEDTVADRATYSQPALKPAGILHVMVNGAWALRNGKPTASRAGRILRREG